MFPRTDGSLTMTMTFMYLALVLAAAPVEADVVLCNARIFDGSGGEPLVGDVAIKGETIVGVGQFEVVGQPRRIEATDLIVSPGFIDLHNHSDGPITRAETRLNRNYLAQGVTTIVTGNCGGGRADVRQYLRQIDETGAGTNVAHLIPQGSLRGQIVGSDNRPPSPSELQRMEQAVAEGMEAGAWGMSTGLIYVPSKYAATDELVALARVVARHGGIYVSHMRNENTRLLESIDETLKIGREAKLPVHISHFKASGRAAWGLAADAVLKVQQARDAGGHVTADQYPYIASSTSLGAMVVPDRYRDTAAFQAALADPVVAKELMAQLREAIESRSGGASLFIASYGKQRDWQGRDLASLAKQRDQDVVDLVVEIQTHGGAAMVNFGMQEEEVRLIMQQPYVAVASDGGAKVPDETVPHPRSYGTFPRKIGRYAIHGNTVTLAASIRSASGLPAEILGLPLRGFVKTGYAADLVVFDPKTFLDTATFEKPHQYATGVRYLLVNGVFAIDEGRVTEKLPGRALRHSVAATD